MHRENLAYLAPKVIDDSDVLIYVLGVLAGFTWKDGRSDKHLEPLFQELVNIPDLPSPMVFLSLEGEYGFLLDKLARIEGAQLLANAETGVTYRH